MCGSVAGHMWPAIPLAHAPTAGARMRAPEGGAHAPLPAMPHAASPTSTHLPAADQAGTAVGSSTRRGSSVSRAITRRWICEVPSYSCMIFASRNSFSTGYSLMKP